MVPEYHCSRTWFGSNTHVAGNEPELTEMAKQLNTANTGFPDPGFPMGYGGANRYLPDPLMPVSWTQCVKARLLRSIMAVLLNYC